MYSNCYCLSCCGIRRFSLRWLNTVYDGQFGQISPGEKRASPDFTQYSMAPLQFDYHEIMVSARKTGKSLKHFFPQG